MRPAPGSCGRSARRPGHRSCHQSPGTTTGSAGHDRQRARASSRLDGEQRPLGHQADVAGATGGDAGNRRACQSRRPDDVGLRPAGSEQLVDLAPSPPGTIPTLRLTPTGEHLGGPAHPLVAEQSTMADTAAAAVIDPPGPPVLPVQHRPMMVVASGTTASGSDVDPGPRSTPRRLCTPGPQHPGDGGTLLRRTRSAGWHQSAATRALDVTVQCERRLVIADRRQPPSTMHAQRLRGEQALSGLLVLIPVGRLRHHHPLRAGRPDVGRSGQHRHRRA